MNFNRFLLHRFRTSEHDATMKHALSRAFNERMDESRKLRTRELLQEYTAMRPIRLHATSPVGIVWTQLTISITRRGLLLPVTAVLLIFGLSGGTALAAESALPGDPLYGIKVHVNEEVHAALAFSPESAAEWEIKRTERRLEEASSLAVSGTLTDENRVAIETNLSAHIKVAGEKAIDLEADNNFTAADEIGARLTSVLEVHENILLSVRAHVNDDTQPNVDSLLVEVENYLNVAISMKEKSEMDIASDSDSGRKVTVAQQQIAAQARIKSAQSFIDQTDASIAPELVIRARTHLKHAQESYRVAEAALKNGESDSAIVYFNGALRTAIDTKTSLSAQMRLIDTAEKKSNSSEKKTVVRSTDVQSATLLMTPTTTATSSAPTLEKDRSSRAILRSVIDTLRDRAEDSIDEEDDEGINIIIDTRLEL